MAIMPTGPKIKKHYIIIVVALLVISIGGRIYAAYWPTKDIKINGETLKVLVADTDKHRAVGLGSRADFGDYQGMLFIFPNVSQHAMVMRDMRFSLDIIWIRDKVIIDMAPNLEPEPGKTENQLTPYFARLPSDMVLELPAGYISQNELKIGDMVEILD
ncbi:MAG: DUF192 domain-containing protein [bacterium]|nr:DUF192 domain-containing protein [bacterium]